MLYFPPTTDKTEIARLVLDEKKYCNPKKIHFGKKYPKFNKISAFQGYLPQFKF